MDIIKKIVVATELCVFLTLVILTAVFGFNKGVWDGEKYFKADSDGNKTTYAGRNTSAVEVFSEEAQNNKIIVHTVDGNAVQLSYEILAAGALKTVTLFAQDGTPLLNDRYYSHAKNWGSTKNNDSAISKYFTETEGFRIGIFDKGLLNMALGNTQTRISGRSGAFLYAVLFMALGFAINFSKGLVEKLDRIFAGVFYDNAKSLRMNELGELYLLLLGCVIFAIGAILLAKGVLLL